MICLKLVTKGEYSSFPLLSVVSVCMFERTQTNPRLYNMTQYANERSWRCSRLKCLEFNMRDYSGGWTKPLCCPLTCRLTQLQGGHHYVTHAT